MSFTYTFKVTGKVIKIKDGDTFAIIVDGKKYNVRMKDIDCPEKQQDFGNVAKQALAAKIFGKDVYIDCKDTDRNGRLIATVIYNKENINEYMVKQGYAWVYTQYCKDEKMYTLQNQARQAQKGLWLQPNAMEPWLYRKAKRNK